MGTIQPATYGKVVGRLLAVVGDGPDEDEYPIAGGFPDAVPLTGSVTFTPRAPRLLVRTATPDPVVAFPTAIEVQLDESGYLTHNGKRGVFLLAPSAAVNPPDWTYRVRFNLQLNGIPVSTPDIEDLELVEYVPGPDPLDPDAGSTAIDLALAAPVLPSSGTPVVRGPAGDSLESVSLSSDGLSLVFEIRRELDVDEQLVAIPALAALASARDDAVAAKNAAVTAKNDATTAKNDAVTAKNDAVTAKGAAEVAAAAAAASAQEAADTVLDGVPNATATVKGGIRLAGDLGGTWDAPTVPGLAAKADLGLDVVATYTSGDFNTLDFSTPGNYKVRGGTGYVTNAPATTAGVWYNVLVVHVPDGSSETASTLFLASAANTATPFARVKYGATWGTWVTIASNPSAISVSEGTTGTATTSRAVRADYLKQIINFYVTGSTSTEASAIGQALAAAADAAAARDAIDALADADGAVTSAHIANGTIVDADISGSAAIALSKLAAGHVRGSKNGTATTLTVWTGTEAQYAALATKDPNTIYFRTA
ncbi:phage upper tail fiber protein [Rhodococcus sp. PD04]|uniref:phage upper tail fiber protein n=1 Tax=Rhodococcus sp. PD04 TaxID=3109594 RepID=UPI002DD9827C|nr:hypothetical protein [Rhodococcus sp. PD04]WSE22314.1 hypothetical protein U9J23_22110 [Rhodococcus sp. PD04]